MNLLSLSAYSALFFSCSFYLFLTHSLSLVFAHIFSLSKLSFIIFLRHFLCYRYCPPSFSLFSCCIFLFSLYKLSFIISLCHLPCSLCFQNIYSCFSLLPSTNCFIYFHLCSLSPSQFQSLFPHVHSLYCQVVVLTNSIFLIYVCHHI